MPGGAADAPPNVSAPTCTLNLTTPTTTTRRNTMAADLTLDAEGRVINPRTGQPDTVVLGSASHPACRFPSSAVPLR